MSTFTLERVTDATVEPILLPEMKRHLREWSDVTQLDADITQLIKTARQWAEDYTSCALIDQRWRLNVHALDCEATRILLHKSPILEVIEVVHIDDDGTETEMNYPGSPLVPNWALREPDSKWPSIARLEDADWPTGRYRIEFRAGYADRSISPAEGGEVVDARFLQAMKLYATANWDRDKDMMEKLIAAAENMIEPLRLERGYV